MKADTLKKSILQYAMQGELVSQDPSDEPASELLKRIKAQKEQLIKEGKIKKEKPLPPITQDEIPYDLPLGWEWVRLGDISMVNGGYAFKSSEYKNVGIRVVRISDFNELGFVNNNIVRYDYNRKLDDYLLEEKNIILCMTGGTVGKSLFIKNLTEPMVTNQRVGTIKILGVIEDYINYSILSPLTQQVITESKNSTNDNISIETIKNFLIPLPPLAEQKRIVERLEEILPLVDEYGKNEEILSEMNQKLPKQIRQSILQYAVQGKLVEQNPQDEPASELLKRIKAQKDQLIKDGKIKKEKPLPPITQDEIPYDLPQGWEWVRISEIMTFENGDRSKNYPTEVDYKSQGIPFYGAKDIINNKLSKTNDLRFISIEKFDSLRSGKLRDKDIVCLIRGSVGKWAEFTKTDSLTTGFINAQMVILRLLNLNLFNYLKIYLSSPLYLMQINNRISGSAVAQMSAKDLSEFIIPLPPLAEQKRIVAKVEELMTLVNKLE